MSEIIVNKKGTILDEEENFKPIHDNFRFYDHFSKFSGLAVAQLYLICAAVTGYEVVSRYIFDSPTNGFLRWYGFGSNCMDVICCLCNIT